MALNSIQRLLNSWAYKKAKSLVSTTLENPGKLKDLIAKAQLKSTKSINAKLAEIIKPVSALFRLLKAYVAGEYRDISFESLALIVASVIYFVMPIDVIPDFLLALGHADDAALLAWTIRSVSEDLDRFLEWEKKRPIDVSIEKE
ncbi:MAG: DUF1232 domain-containing protein [Acidiferrobacterales bacterium]|nr:DUF1232 domain-containing protein [Acidiferrobacterales bacterium]